MIPAPGPTTITTATQDYLKAIHVLSVDGSPVSTQRLAEHLGVTCASVTGMAKRLHGRGLLRHAPYHGVVLTAEGGQVAREVLGRHELLERFLVTLLGMPKDLVHDEAERLEHHLSEALAARIAGVLSLSTVDVAGTPRSGMHGHVTSAGAGRDR